MFPWIFARLSLAARLLLLVLLTPSLMAQQPTKPLDRPETIAGERLQDGEYSLPAGVTYEHVKREEPRPLHIHILRIDLSKLQGSLGMHAMPDPDGDGPAETTLASPAHHCEQGRFAVGINANAWAMTVDPTTGKKNGYVEGGACNIVGLAVNEGQLVSPAEASWSFWIDEAGKPGMGSGLKAPKNVRLAISGFGKLVENGQVSGADKPIHPRTALGLSEDQRMLTCVVVDGRQLGYSEGVSLRELAELMSELDCHNAFNLDGGGSTVMMLRGAQGRMRTANRPSGLTGPRPVPVFLGVKSKS